MSPRQDLLSVDEGRHNGGSAELKPNSGFVSVMLADGANITPQIFTLAWSIRELPTMATAGAVYNLIGRLTWGLGAAAHVAEFDLGRSGHISLVAANVAFEARNAGDGTYNVIGSLAYGTRGAGAASCVTLTQSFTTVDNEWQTTIPSWARKYSVQPRSEGLFVGGAISVQELAPNETLLRTFVPPSSTTIRTLGNDVAYLRVRTETAEPQRGVVIFELTL